MLAASVCLLEARSFLALSIAEGAAGWVAEGTEVEPEGDGEDEALVSAESALPRISPIPTIIMTVLNLIVSEIE